MDPLGKLLFNMKALGEIRPGYRINTTREYIAADGESLIQGVWRTMAGDSRDKTAQVICRDVRLLIYIAGLLAELQKNGVRDTRPQLEGIVEGLSCAERGVHNVINTYVGDNDVSAALQPLLAEIKDCRAEMLKLTI